ncbi:MAG TPA: phage holin family protein [Bacteroidales bacterium]|nr:phage holin family protein [Bacteroidales bacterium]
MPEDINSIKKEIQEYLEIKIDLIRLQAAESLSHILSSVASIAIYVCLVSLILLFLSFAAGYFFASVLNSNELGFLCVAGFYTLALIIILIFKKKIIDRPIIKAIVKLFFPRHGDENKS